MATRSTISIQYSDGAVKTVYCHWDGYPSNVGQILVEHFVTEDKVEKLLGLGSISNLAASIECPAGHSFDTPVKGHTVFYGRDRGEDEGNYLSKDWASVEKQEFNYLFMKWADHSEWLVESQHGHRTELVSVADILDDKDYPYNPDPINEIELQK
jgi:hypothetical protein